MFEFGIVCWRERQRCRSFGLSLAKELPIVEKLKKQIDLLKEYRTTLISEVVTGKIDVRDEVAA